MLWQVEQTTAAVCHPGLAVTLQTGLHHSRSLYHLDSFRALLPSCTEHDNAYTSLKPSTMANRNCSWTVALSEEDPQQLQSISATTDGHPGVQITKDISWLPWCKTRSCSAPMGAVTGLPWSQGSCRPCDPTKETLTLDVLQTSCSELLEFLPSLDALPPPPVSCHALQLASTLKTG